VPTRRSRLVPAEASDVLADALAQLRTELALPGPFPADAQAEAEAATRTVPLAPGAELADLRDLDVITLDPAGTTDLDQAMHLQRTASGAVLHYAIADVPAFVAAGGALDAETRRRGQTLYGADGRIPLHPDVLGVRAASLLPGVDRRAFVWRCELDEGARPQHTTLTRAVIRSRAQWAYPDAQRAIDAGSAPETLQALEWFGAQRDARESERGGASLNLPETSIVAAGGRYRLERSAPLPVEDWNAHVSLLTGMAAASIMLAGGVGILRVMPAADHDDVESFRAHTVALGRPWNPDVRYGDYLRTLERDDPATLAIRDAAVGLFRGAGYVAFDGAPPAAPLQAAIGAPYAHTTAPLRRLVDRWSLVVCEALANGRPVPKWARTSLASLPALMAHSDQAAARYDAESIRRVTAAVLHGREGERFHAVVLGGRGHAERVQLTHPPITVRVPGLAAPPAAAVTLRLQRAEVATGDVEFAAE